MAITTVSRVDRGQSWKKHLQENIQDLLHAS